MLWIVSLVLAAVAVIVLIALFAPLDLTFSVAMPRTLRPRVRVRWLHGIVAFERDLRVGAKRATPREPAAAKSEKRRDRDGRGPRFRKARRGGRIARGLLRIEGLGGETLRLIVRLFKAAQWRRLAGTLRLGLAEPSETGELCGVMGPLMVFMPRGESFDFRFEPDFAGPAFELQAQGSMRVIPADVLGALLHYILSGPALRGLKVVAWDSRLETS